MNPVKSVLCATLQRVLGRFIEGAETMKENIDLQMVDGTLTLRNMALREDCLAPAPFAATGSVGTIFVRVPWAHLDTQPCRIEADSVFAMLRPAQGDAKRQAEASARFALRKHDKRIKKLLEKDCKLHEAEKEREKLAKKAEKERQKALKKAARTRSRAPEESLGDENTSTLTEMGDDESETEDDWDEGGEDTWDMDGESGMDVAEGLLSSKGWVANMTKRILANLQISVRNVHLRCETEFCALGITLASLEVKPSAAHFSSSRKDIQVSMLSVYCDAGDLLDKAPVHEKTAFSQFMRMGILQAGPAGSASAGRHMFIIPPSLFSAFVEWPNTASGAASERRSLEQGEEITPKSKCHVSVTSPLLKVEIHQEQYQGIIAFVDSQPSVATEEERERRAAEEKRQKLISTLCPRPKESPKETPKAWWRYAVKVIQTQRMEYRQRLYPLPSELFESRQKSYEELFRAKWLGKKTGAEKVCTMEQGIPLEQTFLFRSISLKHCRKDEKFMHSYRKLFKKQEKKKKRLLQGDKGKSVSSQDSAGTPQTAQAKNEQMMERLQQGVSQTRETSARKKAGAVAKKALNRLFHRKHKETDDEGTEQQNLVDSRVDGEKQFKLQSERRPEGVEADPSPGDLRQLEKQFSVDSTLKTQSVIPPDAPLFEIALDLQLISAQVYQRGKNDSALLNLTITNTRANLKLGRNPRQELSLEVGNIELCHKDISQQSSGTSNLSLISTHCTGTPFLSLYYLVPADNSTRLDVSLSPTTFFVDQDIITQGCTTFELPSGKSWNSISEKAYGWVSSFTTSDKTMKEARDIMLGELSLFKVKPALHGMILNIEFGSLNVVVPTPGVYDAKEASIICLDSTKLFTCTEDGMTQYDAHTILKMSFQGNKLGDGLPISASVKLYAEDTEKTPETAITIGLASFNLTKQNISAFVKSLAPLISLKNSFSSQTDQNQRDVITDSTLSAPKIRNGPLSMLASLPHDMACTISFAGMKMIFSDDETQLLSIQLDPLQITASVHDAVACAQAELMIRCEENEGNNNLLELGSCIRASLGADGIVNVGVDIKLFNICPSVHFLESTVREISECFLVIPLQNESQKSNAKSLKMMSHYLSFIHVNISVHEINAGITGTLFTFKLNDALVIFNNNITVSLAKIIAGFNNEKPLVELDGGSFVCDSLNGINCTFKSLIVDTTNINELVGKLAPIITCAGYLMNMGKGKQCSGTKEGRGNPTKMKCQVSIQKTSVLLIDHTLVVGMISWNGEQGKLGTIRVDGVEMMKTTEQKNAMLTVPMIEIGLDMSQNAEVKTASISLNADHMKMSLKPEDVFTLLDSFMMISSVSLEAYNMIPKKTEQKSTNVMNIGIRCGRMEAGLEINEGKGFGICCDDVLVNFLQTGRIKEITTTFQGLVISEDIGERQVLEKEEESLQQSLISMKMENGTISVMAKLKKIEVPTIDILFILDSIPTLFSLVDDTTAVMKKYPSKGSKIEFSAETEPMTVSIAANKTILKVNVPKMEVSANVDKRLTIYCGPLEIMKDDGMKLVTVSSISMCLEQAMNNYSASFGTIDTSIKPDDLKYIMSMVQSCTQEMKKISLKGIKKGKTGKGGDERIPNVHINTGMITCSLSLNGNQDSDKIALLMKPLEVLLIEGRLNTTIKIETVSVFYHSAQRKEDIMRNQIIELSGAFNAIEPYSVHVTMDEFAVNAGSTAICSITQIVRSCFRLTCKTEGGNKLSRIHKQQHSTEDSTATTTITDGEDNQKESGMKRISGKAILSKLKLSCFWSVRHAIITWKNKGELEFSLKGYIKPEARSFANMTVQCLKLRDIHESNVECQDDELLMHLKEIRDRQAVVEIEGSLDDEQDSVSVKADFGEVITRVEMGQVAEFIQDIEQLQTRLCAMDNDDDGRRHDQQKKKKMKIPTFPENLYMRVSAPRVLIQLCCSQRQMKNAKLKHNVDVFGECSVSLRCTVNRDATGTLTVEKIGIYAGTDSSRRLSAFSLLCHEVSTNLLKMNQKTPKLVVRFLPVKVQVHRGLLEDFMKLCKETRELFHKPELSYKADRLDTSHRAWPIPYNEYRKETLPTVTPLRFEHVKQFLGMPLLLDVAMASLHTELVASEKETVLCKVEPMSLRWGNQLPCAFEAVLSVEINNAVSQRNVVLEPLDCLVTGGYLPYPMVHICTTKAINVRLTPDAISTILLLIRGKGFSLKDKKPSLEEMGAGRYSQDGLEGQNWSRSDVGQNGHPFYFEIENRAKVDLYCVFARNKGRTEKTGPLVSFKLDGWEEMPFESLSTTTHQAFCLRQRPNSGEEGKTLWLLAKMKEDEGTKNVVEVVAPITLENTLQYPLEVAHPTSIISGEQPSETSVIYPRKGEPVHVFSSDPENMTCVRARIILKEDRRSDWFDIPLSCPLEVQEVHFRGDSVLKMYVNTLVKSPGSVPVLGCTKDNAMKRMHVVFLTVHPGMIVHNKVPLPLTLRLSNGSKSEHEFYEVAQIEQTQSFGCSGLALARNKGTSLMISAKIGEHNDTWSTPVEVHLDTKTRNVYNLMFVYATLLNAAFWLSNDGQWHCEIHAPCWYLNTTGIPLELDGLAVVYPSEPGRLGIFCPSSTGGVRVRVKAESKEEQQLWKWTNNIAIRSVSGNKDGPQTSMAVVPGPFPSVIRVVVDYTTRAQENTLVLSFVPAVLFQNGSSKPVQLCQPQSDFADRRNAIQVEPGHTLPVHYKDLKDARVSIKIDEYGWSTPFCLTTTKGPFSLRLWDQTKQQCTIVPLETSVDAYGTRRWVLRDDEGLAPCIIQNFTGTTLRICQKGAEEHTLCVGPRRQVHFAWDNPEQPRILCVNSQEIDPTTPVTVVRFKDSPGAPEHCIESNHVQVKSQSIYRLKERCISQIEQKIEPEDLGMLEFEAVATLPGLQITLEDNKVVTCRVLVQGGTKTRPMAGPGIEASYKLGKGYDEVTMNICSLTVTSDDKEVPHQSVLSCPPNPTQRSFLVGNLKRMLPGSGRKLVDVQNAELQVQEMLLAVDEELLDATLFFIEKIVPAEVAESYNIEDAANRVAQKSQHQTLHHKDMWPLFIRKLSISPIRFRLAFTPRQPSFKYRSKMSSWLSWGCSVLGSITDTEVIVTAFERDRVPYADGFAPFKAELQAHYLNEISTKILGVSRGSGPFGTTINFFARLFLTKKSS